MDPRHATPETDRHAVDPAARRLCGHVARVLRMLFTGLAADDDLDSLEVLSVEPAPDATRLRVRLRLLGACRSSGLLRPPILSLRAESVGNPVLNVALPRLRRDFLRPTALASVSAPSRRPYSDRLLAPTADIARVLARLAGARGWIRSEVAEEIRRRKAPDLAFVVEPSSADAVGGAP